MNQCYEKFMLVLNVGGPVDLSSVAEVSNILVLSQLGVETGRALSDILLGKTQPSGKLTTTWTSWKDYCSIGSFGEKDDTDFALSEEQISVDGEKVTIRVKVANLGVYAGKETVQVYVSAPGVGL